MKKRTIIIGDVHGCLDELADLLIRVGFYPEKDRVIIAGDLVDRGPDSVGVVQFCEGLGIEAVMGNHEEKHIRKFLKDAAESSGGPKNQMRPFTPKRQKEHQDLIETGFINFLVTLPPFINVKREGRNDLVVVHGGLEAFKPFHEQKLKHVCRIRYVDKDSGRFKSSDKPEVVPANSTFWHNMWSGPEDVAYGHHVHSLGAPHLVRSPGGGMTHGLDTGCVFGGHLTALILEEDGSTRYFQVPARKQYAALRDPDLV